MKLSNVLLVIVVLFTAFDIYYTANFGEGSKLRGASIIESISRIESSLQRIEKGMMK